MKTLFMRRALRSIGIVGAATILSISSTWVPLYKAIASATPSNTVNVGSPVSGNTGVALAVPGVSVTGTGTLVVNVAPDSGTVALPDPSTGVAYTNGASDGTSVTLSGTAADINTALSGMTYTGNSVGTRHIHVVILPEDGAYDPVTQHMYTYDDTHRTWTSANTFAQTQTIDGVSGYMATVTSDAENNILLGMSSTGWLGGKYVSGNSDFEWVNGPENGTSVASHNYDDWDSASGQPVELNQTIHQDCMAMEVDDNNNSAWYASQCSPSVAYRFGTYIEYDVSSVVVSADQEVDLTPTVHTVANCTQLQAMDSDFSTYGDTFELTADIDCQNVPFTPLFWGQSPFGGTFNGQGHSISGLNISTQGSDAGLFSDTSGATIENLTLAAGDGVHALDDNGYSGIAGALVGMAEDTTITGVVSHLNVTSDDNEAGGLVGDVESDSTGSTISDSAATGDVSGWGEVGGLLGYADGGGANLVIEHDYSTGTVTAGSDYVGGLIGDLEAGDDNAGSTVTVQNVYSWSNVSAPDSDSVGGLIGEIDTYSSGSTIDISNAYASGIVVADDYVGGLIGTANYNGDSAETTLTNVFSVAALTVMSGDPSSYGYIIGDNEGWDDGGPTTGSGIYYDSTNSGIAGWYQVGCANDSDASLDGCTDVNADGTHNSYFLDNHVNAPMDSWNFSTIWFVNAGALPTFAPTVAPDDNDGVSSGIENSAPNSGDGNNDGTIDSSQANVSSFVDAQTGSYVTVAAPGPCSLSAVSSAAETANAKQDGSYSYPDGMVNYTANCGTNGYTATMHLYFYGQTNANQVLRKYDPSTQTYTNVPGTSLTSITIGGQSVVEATYDITDGGPLDTDGAANGVIVDPVGLALTALATNQSVSGTSGGGLVDTGINVVAISGLAALLIAASVVVAKRKSVG